MLVNKKYISVTIDESMLKESGKALAVLFDISNTLSVPHNLEKHLQNVLSKVLEYFDLDAGRIYLWDDIHQKFSLTVHKGMDTKGLEQLGFDEGFSGKAARTRSFIAQFVSELEDRERAALLVSKGFKIIICVPLLSMDRIGGVMNLATGKEFNLDQEKIGLMSTIGNQIAMAVDNAKLYEDLEKRIDSLKEKNELIKFFAHSVSHDLKSPATSMYGLTKRLKEKYERTLNEKGREYCDQIMKAAEQMVELVDKINSFIISKEALLNYQMINPGEIITELRLEFSSRLKDRKIKWSQPDTLPQIIADRLSLLRVFRNFIDNALKYGGEDMKEINIEYKETEDFHTFSFSDDGVELKAKDNEVIFKQFNRQETSLGTSGSGLGLAIVKEIAERHKGQAWMDSSSKKGTTFCISVSKDLNVKR